MRDLGWLCGGEADALCFVGDLHDGNGLSDAAKPNGLVSNPIFENIHYDLLSIGINALGR